MEFADKLRALSNRVAQIKDQLKTEEATKTSIIMPFFQLLGYDVFNPSEFHPEFVSDVGIKKGEKVDYAIMKNDKPVILIEAKWSGESLEKHDSQLFRYFGTTPAKFAILTNGIIYRFYTDLEEQNKMDLAPFFEFNLLELKDSAISELKKFEKQQFDIDVIFNAASELKYSGLVKQFFAGQLEQPSDDFVAFVASNVYAGRKTQAIIDKFREIVRRSLNQYISELMNERIKSALEKESKNVQLLEADTEKVTDPPQKRIETTMEELEGFFIVRAILRDLISATRITYKDTESYFGILIDGNSRKWLCRLDLSGSKKYVYIPTEEKEQTKHQIASIDEIYSLRDQLLAVTKRYL